MSRVSGQPIPAPTIPELEHLLVRAARRRTASRLGRRRWALAAAAASLLVAAGGAAATGVFQLAGGETAGGAFSVESRVVPATGANARNGSVCLQLTFSGRGAAYGCGERPGASKPFGLVVADPLDNRGERVVYGLVADAISRVEVLGGEGSAVEAETREHSEVPGRFFVVVAPRDGQIELVGYSADGKEVARFGSLEPPAGPPLSKAEAIEQGDPAGFAPAVTAPEAFVYKGEPIKPRVATRLGIACMQEVAAVRCYDSIAESEAAQGR
jgi:hypothetical protein